MKSNKQLLFEMMEKVNPDFQQPQENVPETEQEVVNNILSLNEGIDSILNKIKEYGKRGLLTAAILLAVALSASGQDIKVYERILDVGRHYTKPKVDIVGGQPQYNTDRKLIEEFNVEDVNYYYLANVVQDLNSWLERYNEHLNKKRKKISGSEKNYDYKTDDLKNWVVKYYELSKKIYNFIHSGHSNDIIDIRNFGYKNHLPGKPGEYIPDYHNFLKDVGGDINNIDYIKYFIENGKKIKLVDGNFEGGLPSTNFGWAGMQGKIRSSDKGLRDLYNK